MTIGNEGKFVPLRPHCLESAQLQRIVTFAALDVALL
jgi:hypothetical protein